MKQQVVKHLPDIELGKYSAKEIVDLLSVYLDKYPSLEIGVEGARDEGFSGYIPPYIELWYTVEETDEEYRLRLAREELQEAKYQQEVETKAEQHKQYILEEARKLGVIK